jgi:hypothetical protein
MTSGTIDKSESESAQLFTKITLRATRESDLQTFFEYQLDPIANRMAAFTAKDPTDRDACMTSGGRTSPIRPISIKRS